MSMGGVRRIAAVVRLEVLVQRREPLTVLYMLVLGLLAMAFAANGPIELVRGRGAVPRDAGWSLMLASTALTAFGQVITTMVAATVVLRDHADRVHDLIAATALTLREYRLGKLLAALAMLLLIYAAVPIGLMLGALIQGGAFGSAFFGSVRPFLLVVVPTMLAIGMLQFAAGIMSGRLWTIVGLGLVLIWLWSAAVDSVTRTSSPTGVSLLDPFGSAPLLQATASWTDAERRLLPMPLPRALILSRLGWFGAATLLAWVAIMHAPRRAQAAVHHVGHGPHRTQPQLRDGAAGRALARGGSAGFRRGAVATAVHVARWMLRDAGWRVLSLLGAVNVGVHALVEAPLAASPADATAHAMLMLGTHARLFLILLATIYAGELVWRERDDRSAPLLDTLPITTGAMVAGRIAGCIVAQCALVGLLAGVAGAATVMAVGRAIEWVPLMVAVATQVAVPFVGWMLLALLVHVLVQQKVVAHLLVIAGWVLAVLASGGSAATGDVQVPARVWLTVVLVSGVVSALGWMRGGHRRVSRRGRLAASGVENR